MRREVRAVLDALLAASKPGGEVTLDAIGEAFGTSAASHDDIDALISTLEKAGRAVTSPPGGHGETTLRAVVAAARAIREEGGDNPTARQIAARTGLPLERVKHALALVRVIAR